LGGLFIKEYNMEMDELDLLYKTRIVLREKGFVVLKEPVQEFYKNLFNPTPQEISTFCKVEMNCERLDRALILDYTNRGPDNQGT